MNREDIIRQALQSGERHGLIRYRENPTLTDVRSHYFNLGLYASFFLSPFLIG